MDQHGLKFQGTIDKFVHETVKAKKISNISLIWYVNLLKIKSIKAAFCGVINAIAELNHINFIWTTLAQDDRGFHITSCYER